ncbi:cytochrome c oxidase subunit II [bacterium]|jgi:cytochrome c oxidase subunit II|nr:cytochrome c oxidase subunit II [bacterium]MDA7905886.1 cytochrome c oxidase subunit II [Mariniblastus sp.]MDA7887557.1 cytochrome c oxidase subunit II [bacterium]MDA7901682.1 cytochrome c oxidase subunit II [bacterium]MDB4357203.1 cytochrome c oxidase subunit II [Mariniblastus sp.]
MNRFWSVLFLLVPILGIASVLMAMYGVTPLESAWLPKSLSQAGDTIDQLFNGIHLLAAFILAGTVFTIGWALWRFGDRGNSNEKARYVTHNTKLEITWTVIPALILVFLAFFQMKSWAENKMDRPTVTVDGVSTFKAPMVMVKAKRFGWEFYYAGDDGIVETQDDIFVENLLVLPAGEEIVLQLESRDVIHSFYVPELRLKQDIVPGMTQFVWFNAREEKEIEIMCTELCGWGHYMMKADLNFVSRAQFDAWIEEQKAAYSPEFKNVVEPSASLGELKKLHSPQLSKVSKSLLEINN